HEVALREYLLALLADLEVVEEHRGVRMRGAARDADSVRPRDRRADREPVDRRALALELFGLVIVYGQRERHLTRHDELREQRMPLAHRHAVFCDDLLEEFRAPDLADLVEKAREPVRVLLLDTEFPLPLRVEQVFPGLRQILLPHGLGVVRLHEHVQARADPFAMGTERGRGENRARGEQAREKAESRRPHSDSFRIFSPLRKRSDQSFSQRSASSSVITGSIISKGNLLRCVSTARLEGTRLRSFRIVWPSRESMKSAKSSAAFGCGARRATPIAFGRPNVGLSAFQRMGAPFTTSRSALWL